MVFRGKAHAKKKIGEKATERLSSSPFFALGPQP